MTMPARYSGTCPNCGERWQPGELIRSTVVGYEHHEVWQHTVCPESVEEAEGAACDRCFLRRSLTGECGCDDDE